jgi:two-component system, NtrC family, response regulator AtoC
VDGAELSSPLLFSPQGCLVRSVLLVLSILRSSENRSLVCGALAGAGHKLVQASGIEQAQILLSNGLEPDLIIFEPSSSAGLSHLSDSLQFATKTAVCIVCEPVDLRLKSVARALGMNLFLDCPLVERDVNGVLDRSFGVEAGDAPVEKASGLKSGPERVLEELGDGRYFLAASPSMLKIYRQVQLLADVDAPVLILGESGTGKEVIAHLIHKHSRRSQQRFVNVNCAALPAELLESELFGYQQGAFTGAIKDKPGKFELANRGTLLLDEIGEMSAQMQAKLLHVLQDGQFSRLGARESGRANVRVVAATNVEIERALVAKTFREDLFYRLNVFTIKVPALRERRTEIPDLVEEIIRRSPKELRGADDFSFSSEMMEAVLQCEWRGNVRELRNFVTRTMTMRDPEMAMHELEAKIGAGSQMVEEPERLNEASVVRIGMRSAVRDMKDRAEAQMVQNALEVSGWNRRHAAKYLNISYRGLLYKIQQHQLVPRATTMPRSS